MRSPSFLLQMVAVAVVYPASISAFQISTQPSTISLRQPSSADRRTSRSLVILHYDRPTEEDLSPDKPGDLYSWKRHNWQYETDRYVRKEFHDEMKAEEKGPWGRPREYIEALESKKDAEAIEMKPVGMSKNAGNRFVAFLWDRLLDTKGRNPLQMHEDRIEYTEDHIINARKANLYNETFNTDSMVDVMWSRQILSTDLQRVVGQAMCLESTGLHHVLDFLREKEPLMDAYGCKGDISNVHLFRWRHYRDHTLRIDDGRNGFPCMMLGLQKNPLSDEPEDPEIAVENEELRKQSFKAHLEYLIKSERVIACGSLHAPTPHKNDPESQAALGDLVFFNSPNREHAVKWCEDMPRSQMGLYDSVQTHFYNMMDVTGKFVAHHRYEWEPCEDLKEAMTLDGYPTGDLQTQWLNS